MSACRCLCPHCGGAVEFPPELAGTSVDCPHCGDPLDLVEAPAVPPEAPAPGRWTASELALALKGRVPAGRVSARYAAALGLGLAAVLALPAAYLALVGVVAWGLCRGALFVFRAAAGAGAEAGGVPAWLVAGVGVPGLALGLGVLGGLLRPFLARTRPRASPLALNPAAEPLLFAFLGMVCDAVGAPLPARVVVDCRPNASAGFRGGWGGLLRGDLVLTLGLPLVAALDLRQLAGVLAHELGHFRQRFGLRSTVLIRAVDVWLARAVRERDAWDERVAGWTHGGLGVGWRLLAVGAGLALGLSRGLLGALMLASRAANALLLREMEHEADRCEVAVAGTAAFLEARRRLSVLAAAARPYYQSLRARWDRDRSLPDHFPAGLVAAAARVSEDERERMEARADRREARWSDTHPRASERLERAEAAAAPGLFDLAGPATALFTEFDVLARQATRLHYTEVMGLPASELRVTDESGPAAGAAGRA